MYRFFFAFAGSALNRTFLQIDMKFRAVPLREQ